VPARPPKPPDRPTSPRFKKREKQQRPTKSLPEDAAPIIDELRKQTDRGAAIIAATFLDNLLQIALERRFLHLSKDQHKALFGRMAPLSTFSAKIEIAYAAGLFGKSAYNNIQMIRNVRNKFAHKLERLHFDHPQIAKFIDDPQRKKAIIGSPSSRRDEFLITFALLIILLYGYTAEDIRLLPLGKTHPAFFAALAQTLQTMQETLRSAQNAKPRS
jgi:DNA-binding MltR family transcriptional regulator